MVPRRGSVDSYTAVMTARFNKLILDSEGFYFSFSDVPAVRPAAYVRVFQEKESIAKCITDLKALAKNTKAQATA